MGATPVILALIIAILGFLVSPFGLFTLLLGIVTFLLAPPIYRATGLGKRAAGFPLWLVARMMGRGAIVVSEHNDLLFKKMKFDDLGVETITFGDERKEFEDPDGAIHTWKGMTFALADEVTGVLFDPRHSALGQRKHDADERGEGRVYATESEWEETGITEWVKGIFEFPKHQELVDLSDVRHLVDGGERSEYPKRVEELYKNSRLPFASGSPMTKFFYPIFGFLMTFGGIWFMASQLGGSGASSTVSFGGGVLYLLLFGTGGVNAETIKSAGLKASIGAILIVPVLLLAVFFGPILAFVVMFIYLLGYLLIPIVGLLSKPSKRLSGGLSSLMLINGFMAYDRPVWKWTPRGYELIEYNNLDDRTTVHKWYGLANKLVGFTFEASPASWGAEHIPNDKLDSRTGIVTDGGKTNIPPGHQPVNVNQRGRIGGFGPKRTSRANYYLHSGIALARFEDSAVGSKSMRRLAKAKEKYGEDAFSVSDKAVLYMTAGAGLLGVVLGTLVFLL